MPFNGAEFRAPRRNSDSFGVRSRTQRLAVSSYQFRIGTAKRPNRKFTGAQTSC